jgi:hypothetical protein
MQAAEHISQRPTPETPEARGQRQRGMISTSLGGDSRLIAADNALLVNGLCHSSANVESVEICLPTRVDFYALVKLGSFRLLSFLASGL